MAATVTTVIDFDSLGSSANVSVFLQDGYQMVSLNVENSTQCATGKCIQENGQGFITTLTRTDGKAFDLDSFYFSLQGNGQNASNDVTVTANLGNSFTYALGDNDSDGQTNGLLSIYDNTLNVAGPLLGNGVIAKSTGSNGPNYVVSYVNEFDGILAVSWFGATTANTRIDDITLTRMTPVPLPASGLLLIGGLFGLRVVSRKRK